MTRTRRLLLLMLWFGTGVVSLLLAGQAGNTAWVPLAALAAVVSLATIVIAGPGDVLFYMAVYVALQFGVKPFVIWVDPTWDVKADALQYLWKSFLVFQLEAFAAFAVAYVLFVSLAGYRKPTPLQKPWRASSSQVIALAGIYAATWVARVLLLSGHEIGLLGHVSRFSSVLVVALVLVLFRSERPTRLAARPLLLLLVIFVGDGIWGLLTQTKLPVLLDLVASIFALAQTKRFRWWQLLVVGLTGLVVMGGITVLRHPSRWQGVSLVTSGIHNLIERSDTFDTGVRVFSMTPGAVPFWGTKMLVELAHDAILPLSPGKSFFPGLETSKLYYGYTAPVHLALGLATSWYVTGGIVVGILGMLLTGAVFGASLGILLARRSWWRLVFAAALFVPYSDLEQSYLQILNYAQRGFLLSIAVYILWLVLRTATSHSRSKPVELPGAAATWTPGKRGT